MSAKKCQNTKNKPDFVLVDQPDIPVNKKL